MPSGFLVNHYDLNILNQVITTNVNMGETVEIMLGMKSGDGFVFLTPQQHVKDVLLNLSIPVDTIDGEPMRRALKAMKGAVMAPDYRGIDVISAYQHIPIVNWGLVVKKDKKEVFAPLRLVRTIALIVGAVSAAAVALAGIIFAISVSKPIIKLTYATEMIVQGDWDHVTGITTRGEIGTLANSFDTMRAQIGGLLKNVEEDRKDWESTFNTVGDIICLWDKENRLVRCNKAFLKRLNVKPEEIIGKKCHEIFHQTNENKLTECAVIEMSKTMKTTRREYEVPRLGGAFNIASFPRLDDNGEFAGTVQIMKDITKRKQKEAELVEYSRQLDETNKMLSMKNQELSVINKINSVLSSSLGLEKTLNKVLDKILKVFNVEEAGIYLVDKESSQLKLVGCKGFSKKEAEILEKHRIGERFYNRVANTNEAIIIKDVKSDKYMSSTMKVMDDILSIAVTPLISQDNVIGTLFLSTRKSHSFSDENIKFFTLIGSQIGIALDNCMLFEEINSSKMKWENTFNTISDSICIIDNKLRIVRANHGTSELVGMRIKDIVGRYYYEIFHGSDKPLEECTLIKSIEEPVA